MSLCLLLLLPLLCGGTPAGILTTTSSFDLFATAADAEVQGGPAAASMPPFLHQCIESAFKWVSEHVTPAAASGYLACAHRRTSLKGHAECYCSHVGRENQNAYQAAGCCDALKLHGLPQAYAVAMTKLCVMECSDEGELLGPPELVGLRKDQHQQQQQRLSSSARVGGGVSNATKAATTTANATRKWSGLGGRGGSCHESRRSAG
ncbi:unnamed protein product [Vitrella brassicaformis CCMP3155]|uniref:Uncharacterized protein n=1 Tax=Vitrella brassicaformis (strain CCMP3155) TaxID=1169540 RepID=A0A0G4EBJ6_VITBC|nr:unnamed protein product [Vitrella brassicaformis CCMP3155]|eukprot:CEL92659.1 unnamed protein product [Vitrella brassicaformis CCMP3155]